MPPSKPTNTGHSPNAQAAREAAEKLEATFLAEMLKSAGLGTQANSMSGGIGEDQFASFHRQALADAMVESGGIGLAETIYNAMMERSA
ncbi:MAG: rod-binding protein [Roseovarius sp.]